MSTRRAPGGRMRALLAGAILATAPAIGAHAGAPSFESVRTGHVLSDAVLLDRHGQPLHELRVDLRLRRLPWVPLADVSPALVQAVIDAEDRRFHEHGGADWRALAAAALRNPWSHRPRGASTITMQLVSLLDPGLKATAGRRTVSQKWAQVRAARELERTWSKAQILEAYLNRVPVRGELEGMHAAARGLFGKAPGGLDAVESALLVASLRATGAAPRQVADRACAILTRGGQAALCAGLALRASAAFNRGTDIRPATALAPHVARTLLGADQRRVTSSLDRDLQAHVLESLQHHLSLLSGGNARDGAALVVDNATGEVLAYAGNAGQLSSARYVDGVRAPRQAGSVLKPFLYQLALERRMLTAASLLDDSPVNLATPGGLYVPQNYDREFRGLVSVRASLAGSLNIPAVRTLMLLGPDAFVTRLRSLGFDGLAENGDYYGYSLALGSAEVDLWELVNAYRTLGNGGVAGSLTLLPRDADPVRRPVLAPEAVHVVSDILADRAARSTTFGLHNVLSTPYWSAVKTGTSKDMRDNWCVGYTSRYTVGVWVGNFSGEPMRNVSGVSGAAPVWLDIMNRLHRDDPGRAPARPGGVVVTRIAYGEAAETPRDELFLAGTELARADVRTADAAAPKIAYPGNGAIIALDPDIPPARQRVPFEMHPAAPGFRWQLDGANLEGDAVVLWQPVPGRHRLALVDAAGREADRVGFEVRGGPRRARPAP